MCTTFSHANFLKTAYNRIDTRWSVLQLSFSLSNSCVKIGAFVHTTQFNNVVCNPFTFLNRNGDFGDLFSDHITEPISKKNLFTVFLALPESLYMHYVHNSSQDAMQSISINGWGLQVKRQ
jgi:hypothetical protein